MRQTTEAGGQVVLIGLRGRHWQDESLQALISDSIVHESRYQLCRLGNIKVTKDSPHPSEVKLHAYTSFKATDLQCKCGDETTHTYELSDMQKLLEEHHNGRKPKV